LLSWNKPTTHPRERVPKVKAKIATFLQQTVHFRLCVAHPFGGVQLKKTTISNDKIALHIIPISISLTEF